MFGDDSVKTRRLLIGVAVFATIFAVVVRIYLSFSSLGKLDSDEAITLLMAKDMSHGHMTALFYGQEYGGIQEPFLMVPFVALFGMHTWIVRLIPFLITLCAGLLIIFGFSTARKEKRLYDPYFWAGLIFLCFPASLTWWSIKASGFYSSAMAFGILTFFFAHVLMHDTIDPEYRVRYWISTHRTIGFILMGVSAGMSWWATPQAMLFIAPLTLWLLLDFRRTLPKVGFATLGFLVGSFPWIYRNLHTHFLSFNTDGIPPTSYIFRVRTFFGLGFPTLLNLRNWMRGPTEFLITTKGAKLVAVVVFIFLAVQAIRIIRDQRKSAAALFSLMFLLYPFIAAISPITFSGGEGRYMWFIVPALCVVLLSSWPVVRSSRMLVGLWIAIIVSGMYVSYVTARGYPDIQRGVATIQFGPVVERILDEDVHYVAANYWTAYRLNAESQGKIVATPFDYGVRIEKNRELVSRRIDGIVFEKNMNGEARIISFLTENDIAYTKKMFDGVTLYKVSRSDFTDEQLHELLNPK